MSSFLDRIKFPFRDDSLEDEIERRRKWIEKHPGTPNIAKIAYFCGCDVPDIINEIRYALEEINEQRKRAQNP